MSKASLSMCKACLTDPTESDLCYTCDKLLRKFEPPNKRKTLTYEQKKLWLIDFMEKIRREFVLSFLA